MNPRTRWILFAFHIQHVLLGWLVAGALLLFRRIERPRWYDGTIRARRRPGDKSRMSLAFLRLIVFSHGGSRTAHPMDETAERHEQTHIWQSEDLAFGGFWLGLLLAALLAALNWLTSGGAHWTMFVAVWELTWLLAPLLVVFEYPSAVARFGVPKGNKPWFARMYSVAYRDSQHERSAYAQSRRVFWNGREYARKVLASEPPS